jgi:hypothetical protein
MEEQKESKEKPVTKEDVQPDIVKQAKEQAAQPQPTQPGPDDVVDASFTEKKAD